MPRTPLRLPLEVEYLSILDENGQVDTDLEPDLDQKQLTKLYRYMLLGRRFDKRLLSLQRQGRIGTFPPVTGQEAAHLGAAAVLRPSDWMAPSFRELVAELWRGRSLESVILASNGFGEGLSVEPERNDLPMSVPVGSQMLHAVGIGWAMCYRGKDDVAMTFFGDGATSEGDFHEALNFAGVFQTPVIFVCQNNGWAISIPRHKQTRSETIAQKALAYGVPGIQVDGNDILAVYAAAKEAVDRARAGKGSTLIESVTYRVMMHTTADDPKRYRSEEEVAVWHKRDPLKRFEVYLRNKSVLSDEILDVMEKDVEDRIGQAITNAEKKMKELGDPLDMFDHAYAEMTPRLKAQRETLARELETTKGGQDG
jgi:pyruvate dehydrogenase E1 component alpha subunit